MHKAIRWSPHSAPDQQRFLLLNLQESSLQLHQVNGASSTSIQYKEIASHVKLPQIRAFEWSSFNESIVGFGLSSGEAALLRVDDPGSKLAIIPIKHQRQCNSIAFSAKGLLATGLDKVRNDFCLNIWDIKAGHTQTALAVGAVSKLNVPTRQLAMSEAVSSVKFFTDQPECLVAGVSGKSLRIYDLRESANPTMQYPTACVHNLSIDIFDPNYFISSSLTHPTVCVWDRRMGPRTNASGSFGGPGGGPSTDATQVGATICYRSCIDVSKRNLTTHIASLRFCRTKSGSFGLLSSAGEMRVYETKKEYHLPWPAERSEALRTSWIRDIEPPFYATYSKAPGNRIESFDFVEMGHTQYGHRFVTIRSSGNVELLPLNPPPPALSFGGQGSLMVGTTESAQMRSVKAHLQGERNVALPGGSEDFSVVSPQAADGRSIGNIIDSVQNKLDRSIYARGRSESDIRQRPDLVGQHNFKLSFPDALTLSMGNVMRYRCEEGYRMNCDRNVRIAAYDSVLQDMWSWIAGAQESAANNGMISGRYDLSYLGVMDVWNNTLGINTTSRLIGTSLPPSPDSFSRACADINERCGRMPFGEVQTAFPQQRQLCLAICGWALPVRELELKLTALEANDEFTKAAGWALFHGFTERAIKALARGGKEMKIMSTAVAGYQSAQTNGGGNGNSQMWKDLCYEMSNELVDKYARAIFAFVSNGDWHDVVHESPLPMRDRLGIALRFLEDDALTSYLTDLHASVIAAGDLEGIALTGLTEATVPLLQSFIDKTGDVQSAVLALSFACPLYFTSAQFDDWRAAYMDAMQGWRAWKPRAWYTLEHTKAATDRDGKCAIRKRPRQIQAGCGFCKQPLSLAADFWAVQTDDNDKNGEKGREEKKSGKEIEKKEKDQDKRGAANPGPTNTAICMHCKHALPACAVCLLPLGQPMRHELKYGGSNPTPAANGGTGDQATSGGTTTGGRRPSGLTTESKTMDAWFNFCVTCNHGYHAGHARAWFERHRSCAVAGCGCECDR